MSNTKVLKFGSYSVGRMGTQLMGYKPFLLDYNPYIWLNNDLNTMSVNGSNRLSQWNDISGNGRNFTQATGSNQPQYATGLINGQAGVNFDGATTGKYMAHTLASQLTGVVEIFMVARMLTAPSAYPYYYGGISNVNRLIHYWYSNEYRLVTTDAGGTAFPIVKTPQTMPTGFQFINSTYDGASSEYREGGTLISSSIALRSAIVDGFTLGSSHGNTDTIARMNGTFCEFAVFNYKLSPTQRTEVNNYFKAKYGL